MFAVLYLPNFRLQAVARLERDLSLRPIGLVESHAKKPILVACNDEAEAHQIAVGMPAALAMARCPQVVLRAPSRSAEQEASEVLWQCAWLVSPRIEATADGLCTIDLTGVSETCCETSVRNARAKLGAVGLAASGGIGRTPRLASYAARSTHELLRVTDETNFLAAQPLAWAEPSSDQATVLSGWGIETLGQLTRLAKAEIGRKLGEEGVRLWERARGGDVRPLVTLAPKVQFHAAMELEHEVETLEPVLFILRRLLERLVAQLESTALVAASFKLKLLLADERVHAHLVRLPEPTAQIEILERALHSYLETLTTTAAIAGVELDIEPVRSLHRQQGLFDTGLRDPHQFAETLARVSAIVGENRVGMPVKEPGHQVDAFTLKPPVAAVPEVAGRSARSTLGLVLRRFRPPVMAIVEMSQGKPTSVHCDVVRDRIVAAQGPWRRSGRWWQSNGWSREEWDVEFAAGGLYRLVRTPEGAWLDGYYD